MSLLTPRLRWMAVLVALLTGGALVAAATGRTGWALATLGVLVGIGCLLLLDIRHRQQVDARRLGRLDASTRTVAGELGELRTSVEERLDALRSSLEASAGAVEDLATAAGTRHEETTSRLARLDYEPVNEVQALLQLVAKVPGSPPLPDVGGWALSAGSLLGIWDVVERERPATIVECGSGSSTLWLCYLARAVGGVRVISLEHKGMYVRRTQELVASHGLADLADVRHARMGEVEVGGERLAWYDASCLADVDTIDLLLVDGPPKSTGPLARYPAVPLLADKLPTGALVVMDDADRPGEQEAMRRWAQDHGVRLERRLSRDAVLLRRTEPAHVA